MALQSYQFVMQTGPNPGKVFLIQKTETTIGRDEKSDIFILDSGVSRHHAVLSLQGPNYVIKDLGSTNGTFVNEQRLIAPRALKPGDIILLGDKVRLVFDVAKYDPDVTIQRARPPIGAVEAEAYAQPVSAVSQAAPVPPAAGRAYSPRPAPSAMLNYEPERYDAEDERRRKMVPWIAGGVGCLVISCILVIAFLIWVDATENWCTIMPFLAGCP